jgi:hypothetical protein
MATGRQRPVVFCVEDGCQSLLGAFASSVKLPALGEQLLQHDSAELLLDRCSRLRDPPHVVEFASLALNDHQQVGVPIR